MPLPKIELPTYELTIPSNGDVIKVRPFTVKEEKLLLIAAESKDANEIISTVKQVINNCIIEGAVDINKSPFFDIDYIFIFLRAKSVSETVPMRMTCNNVLEDGTTCGNMFETNMDISNASLEKDEDVSDDIKLDKVNGVRMKYPNYSVVKHLEQAKDVDKKTALIVNSIEFVYDKKGMHSAKDFSKEELKAFVEGLTEENYKKLENFVDNFPVTVVNLEATCSKCGFHHHVRYSDFYDFFT